MLTAVLIALTAVISLLALRLPGRRVDRLVPVALMVLLLAGAAVATALGDRVNGRGHAVVVILALLAAAVGGNQVTSAVFEVVDAGVGAAPGTPAGGGEPQDTSIRSAGDILRGGLWIGALERLAVFATLVARWPDGIAVVLAVKGLGRYPELRAGRRPGLAERFIIGTLVSVLWAGLCAYAATGPALS